MADLGNLIKQISDTFWAYYVTLTVGDDEVSNSNRLPTKLVNASGDDVDTEDLLEAIAQETTLEDLKAVFDTSGSDNVGILIENLEETDFSTESTLSDVLSQLDITTSDLRDAIIGADDKTLSDIDSILNTIEGKDFSTETTLSALKTAFDDEDFASETTLAEIKTKIDSLEAKIDSNIDSDGNSAVKQSGSIVEDGEDKIYSDLEEIKQILRDREDIYGIEVVNTDSDFDITRIGEDVSQSDFSNIMPWAGMRRCTLADDGTVNSYYGDPTYEEDGSDGQVMVEIPKFYYRSYELTDGFAWFISESNKEGFDVFPAFVRDDIEKDYIYFSAYEGCAYDDSESDYIIDDSQNIDWDDDLLSSIADIQPFSGDNQDAHIENCRKIAENRGEGWGLIDFLSVSAVQLLYLIEYADFNMQNTISEGITNLDSGDGNHAQNTGHTSELGNESGEIVIDTLKNDATGADETYAMSYRGIENLYGNIWTWVDGINIQDHVPYIADHGFDSNVFSDPYTTIGEKLAESTGYQSNLAYKSNFDFGFLPIEVEGSSSTYITDYYYQNSGNKVARLGGAWNTGSQAGSFNWNLNSSSSNSNRNRSARLLYIPKN